MQKMWLEVVSLSLVICQWRVIELPACGDYSTIAEHLSARKVVTSEAEVHVGSRSNREPVWTDKDDEPIKESRTIMKKQSCRSYYGANVSVVVILLKAVAILIQS